MSREERVFALVLVLTLVIGALLVVYGALGIARECGVS